MKLTSEEARNVVWEDDSNWEPVSVEEITGQRRWVTEVERIFRHKPTGRTYLFQWDQGSTENQETSPFEYEDNYEPIEVEEKEVTIMKWVPV